MTYQITEQQFEEIKAIIKDFCTKKAEIDEILGTYIELNPHPADILYIIDKDAWYKE